MRSQSGQIDEAVDRAQQVIGRNMTLDAELVEQRFLHHRPLAHHQLNLPLQEKNRIRWGIRLEPPLGGMCGSAALRADDQERGLSGTATSIRGEAQHETLCRIRYLSKRDVGLHRGRNRRGLPRVEGLQSPGRSRPSLEESRVAARAHRTRTAAPYRSGCSAAWSRLACRQSASRPGMRRPFSRHK